MWRSPPCCDGVAPVAPVELPLAEALRCIAAEMPPLAALPPHDIAAADGFALRARDLVGASSYSPLPLAASPVWVEAGDAMPDGLRLRARFRFRRPVRADAAGAGGGDPGAGRSPGRRRYCRGKPCRRSRTARAGARSPDRARGGTRDIEGAPAAAAHRQYSRWHGDGGSDRGKRAHRRRRSRFRRRRRARCRVDCGGARCRRMRPAVDRRRQRRRPHRCER